MERNTSSPSLPEVRVVPAVLGTRWVVTDYLPDGVPLPAGTEVRARLMRSQLATGHLRAEDNIMVLDVQRRWDTQADGRPS